MSQRNKTTYDGSMTMACVRAAVFFTLLLFLVPVQLIMKKTRPKAVFQMPMLFHRVMLGILGFRVRVAGQRATTTPVLYVANHASYLDIPVLGALIPAAFVAKAEVAQWPLFGFLSKLQNTIFIERRSSRSSEQRDQLRTHLEKGQSLILFPEGTSSDGAGVLPFKSSLFGMVDQTFADRAIAIQPISITCTAMDGLPLTRAYRPYYAWYGDMTLADHLWKVFKLGHFTVDVVFHEPVAPAVCADRKALALYCQKQVAQGVEHARTGRGEEPRTLKLLKQPLSA